MFIKVTRSLIPQPHQCVGEETVKVLVGPQQVAWDICRKLLCESSKFFKAALGHSEFVESQTGTVSLSEDDPGLFGNIVNYLYRGMFCPFDFEDVYEVFRTYQLADKLMMAPAKNRLMDLIRQHLPDEFLRAVVQSHILEKDLLLYPLMRQYFIDDMAYISVDAVLPWYKLPLFREIADYVEIWMKQHNSLVMEIDEKCWEVHIISTVGNVGYIMPPHRGRNCTYHDHDHDTDSSCYIHDGM